MSTSPQLLLALDYGGTKHAAALLRVGERTWAAHARVQSPLGADAAYDQATMRRMAHGLLAQVPGRLAAIGVSFGGPVDATRGLVRLSHHVPGWEDCPLRDQLQAEFGVPAAVDNDANVAALGRVPRACCTSPSARGSAAAGCWAAASGAAPTAWPARSAT